MLHFLGCHSGAFARNRSCKRTSKTCFQDIHIEIVKLFPDKRPLIGVNTTFSSDLVVHFFCGPFLPHGVTNANCILFSKVGFFNHMLIH